MTPKDSNSPNSYSRVLLFSKIYHIFCNLQISPSRLAKLKGNLNFSPGGIAFLKENVRKGILPKMLQEILDTRVMVKNSMKLYNKLAKQDPSKQSQTSFVTCL